MKKSQNSVISHFKELKDRVIICVLVFFLSFILAYCFSKEIYQILLDPLVRIYAETGEQKRLIFTGLAEAFVSYINLSFYVALAFTLPIAFMQFYLFLSPGLYKSERKAVMPIFILSPILFFAGGYLVYNYIFPLAFKFFSSFEYNDSGMPIILEARVSEYLKLSMQLIIAFGMAFQFPLIIHLLIKLSIIEADSLRKKRRIIFVFIVIIAAVITPPDIISQIAIAIPLYLLFELSLFLSRK